MLFVEALVLGSAAMMVYPIKLISIGYVLKRIYASKVLFCAYLRPYSSQIEAGRAICKRVYKRQEIEKPRVCLSITP